MRTPNDGLPNERFTLDSSTHRTLQATRLLQEALALLGVELSLPYAQAPARSADRLSRLPEVEHLTGLRRSAICEQMQRGVFLRPVKAGRRAATWSERAIQQGIVDGLDTPPT